MELVKGKKVDHPPGGSKDVCDAVAGVCYWIAQFPVSERFQEEIEGRKDTFLPILKKVF